MIGSLPWFEYKYHFYRNDEIQFNNNDNLEMINLGGAGGQDERFDAERQREPNIVHLHYQ